MNKKIPLFNPLEHDFTVDYTLDDNIGSQSYTIHAKEIEYFDPIIAKHIQKHLATAVMYAWGIKKGNVGATLEEINKKIGVNLDGSDN